MVMTHRYASDADDRPIDDDDDDDDVVVVVVVDDGERDCAPRNRSD